MTNKKKYTTTTIKQFNDFKQECKYWIDQFGLNGWKVYYEHGGNNEDTYATLFTDINGRVATVCFAKEWYMRGVDDVNIGIKEAAKHEMIHLLLARMSAVGEARYADKNEIVSSEEELVRMLEQIIKN